MDDLTEALKVEFRDNSVLPADSNMEDWLQLLDFDPKHVARVRRPDESNKATQKTITRSII